MSFLHFAHAVKKKETNGNSSEHLAHSKVGARILTNVSKTCSGMKMDGIFSWLVTYIFLQMKCQNIFISVNLPLTKIFRLYVEDSNRMDKTQIGFFLKINNATACYECLLIEYVFHPFCARFPLLLNFMAKYNIYCWKATMKVAFFLMSCRK